jgi:hypothetical protein
MNEIAFNFPAIISAAVASFVLGGAYVGIFGKLQRKLNGLTEAESQAKQKVNPKGLVGIFLANLAMAFGLAYFIGVLSTNTFTSVFLFTLWAFIAFVGPLTIGPVLWEGKSIKLWIFNNVINVICLFVMILILTFWR